MMQPLDRNATMEQQVTDEQLVARVIAGERSSFELLMRRHNQGLFRVLRPLVDSNAEAEDVMQETYLRAFAHIEQFEHRSRFSTWLFRIGINEARSQSHRGRRFVSLTRPQSEHRPRQSEDEGPAARSASYVAPLWTDPDRSAQRREASRMLESAICALPTASREVVLLRDVQGLSTSETADCLELSPENVRVRLHRARALLRRRIAAQLGSEACDIFTFGGARCDRVVDQVLTRLGNSDLPNSRA